MKSGATRPLSDPPERLVQRLVQRLRRHALLDALLLIVPPVGAALFLSLYLFSNNWIGRGNSIGSIAAALTLGALAMVLRYRPRIPSLPSAASLIDERTGSQDRFLTLATLPGAGAAEPLLARLRAEAAGYQSRLMLRREFPYRPKKPIYLSLLLSVAAAIALPLLLPLAHSTLRPPSPAEKVRQLAEQVAERPRLADAARALKELAAKLEDPKLTPQDKQIAIEEARKNIEQQKQQEKQQDDVQLLGDAAGTLKGLEKQTGQGQEPKKDQAGGSGDIQTNLPQEGKGEGSQSQGSGGDRQGDLSAQSGNDMQQGKMAQGKPEGPGDAKNRADQKSGGDSGKDPDKQGRDQSNEKSGKSDGRQDQQDPKGGRGKAPEAIPQGAPPTDRFNKPGEGEYAGIKGAGYVTVQLPEELISPNGAGGTKKDSKGGKPAVSQVPVSNVPLPKQVPGAPSEKQPMPLEYRGIIR